MFDSNRVENCTMFEANLSTNTTKCIRVPQNVLINDAVPVIPSTMFEPGLKIYDNETLRNFKFPSNGYM